MKLIGGAAPTLPFSLETESAKSLQARMTAGTLSAETLTKAYLARIALTNAEGPALQAVRALNTHAIEEAKTLDRERATSGVARPAARHPRAARRRRSTCTACRPRAARSRCRSRCPAPTPRWSPSSRPRARSSSARPTSPSSTGCFDANMPEGYSSLGGQVLLPSDTDKTPAGSVGRLAPPRPPRAWRR